MRLAQNWRLQHHRYRLIGSRCRVCDHITIPPRVLCPVCQSQAPISLGMPLGMGHHLALFSLDVHWCEDRLVRGGGGISLLRAGVGGLFGIPQMCR